MIKRAIIRGMWGDGPQIPKAWLDAAKWSAMQHWPHNMYTYTFGRGNTQFLQCIGVPNVRQLSRHEIVNWYDTPGDRNPELDRRINWGLNYWHHKLKILELALKEFDEILWLDWDVYCLDWNRLGDAWNYLSAGPPLRMAQRVYARIQCDWRPDVREKIRGWGRVNPRRVVHHGAFIYCRDLRLVQQAIVLHRERFYGTTDEVAFSYIIDNELTPGGFQSLKHIRGLSLDCDIYSTVKMVFWKKERRRIFEEHRHRMFAGTAEAIEQ